MAAKFKLKIERTGRGFGIAKFEDRYGSKCSIQNSSLATEAAIWLGVDEAFNHPGEDHTRMHLTVPMVKALLPLLQRFVETGSISDE